MAGLAWLLGVEPFELTQREVERVHTLLLQQRLRVAVEMEQARLQRL